ncbi:hypothetical protein OAJ94_01495 [Deltaproteobacteria bacterium]|nr:hypothetical protein [Deltaproteobacteria bacterium]
MTDKKYLMIVDHEVFSTSRPSYEPPAMKLITDLILKGIHIELEEVLDCGTREFHRTGERVFDGIILYLSSKSDLLWNEETMNLKIKKTPSSKVIDLRGKQLKDCISKLKGALKPASNSINVLKQELIKSVELGSNLRAEMIFKVLSTTDIFDKKEAIHSLSNVSKSNPLLMRFVLFLDSHPNEEQIILPSKDVIQNIKIKKKLVGLALMNSSISVDKFNLIIKENDDEMMGLRSLFLSSKSIFSANTFLSINKGKDIMSPDELSAFIRAYWAEDSQLLEHWSSIDKMNINAWEMLTRLHWNQNLKAECFRLSTIGLKYHPNDPNLLRRKAHGKREEGKHDEAIEIELMLLDTTNLSKLDTLIYLCRSLHAIKEWGHLLYYASLGLEINVENNELQAKKLIASEQQPTSESICPLQIVSEEIIAQPENTIPSNPQTPKEESKLQK